MDEKGAADEEGLKARIRKGDENEFLNEFPHRVTNYKESSAHFHIFIIPLVSAPTPIIERKAPDAVALSWRERGSKLTFQSRLLCAR